MLANGQQSTDSLIAREQARNLTQDFILIMCKNNDELGVVIELKQAGHVGLLGITDVYRTYHSDFLQSRPRITPFDLKLVESQVAQVERRRHSHACG
jgi:hypothetical protein